MRGSQAREREGVRADVALEVDGFLARQSREAGDVEGDGGREARGVGDEVGDVVVGGCGVLGMRVLAIYGFDYQSGEKSPAWRCVCIGIYLCVASPRTLCRKVIGITYMRSPFVPARAVDGQVVDVDVAGLGGIVDLLQLSHCFLPWYLSLLSRFACRAGTILLCLYQNLGNSFFFSLDALGMSLLHSHKSQWW